MSSLDLRARLKRDLSQSTVTSQSQSSLVNNSSHGSSLRAVKRWKSDNGVDNEYQRKVSFGFLNETVLFDKKDSSSNLSLGVSVSNSSFGSLSSRGSANFRWGSERTKTGAGNASWNILANPPTRDSRWQGSPMYSKPSATANAFHSLSQHQPNQALPRTFSVVQQQQARCPMRCASPVQSESMELERCVTRQTTLMAPPRRPGRRQSLESASAESTDDPRGGKQEYCFVAAPRLPTRFASPITILPEPINASERDSSLPIFGMPPNRPVRSSSPATLMP